MAWLGLNLNLQYLSSLVSVVLIGYTQEQMESAVKIPQSGGQDQHVMTDEMPLMNFFATTLVYLDWLYMSIWVWSLENQPCH